MRWLCNTVPRRDSPEFAVPAFRRSTNARVFQGQNLIQVTPNETPSLAIGVSAWGAFTGGRVAFQASGSLALARGLGIGLFAGAFTEGFGAVPGFLAGYATSRAVSTVAGAIGGAVVGGFGGWKAAQVLCPTAAH